MATRQLPRYQRADPPPAMRFQPRDAQILQTMQAFDGLLARRHLQALFWPGATRRAMQKRLSLLFHNGYLDWPSWQQWRTHPIPEPICWLGWRGALWLAGQRGLVVRSPSNASQHQLRRLERSLHRQGQRWLRQPRWSLLAHDLAVIDFRIQVLEALAISDHLTLEEWVPESAFQAEMDIIPYQAKSKHGQLVAAQRGVRPDGYFVIRDGLRQAQGQPARARFLLELDNATHDTPSFGREKVAPGIAYLKHAAYRERFGTTAGRWLVVVSGGQRRMRNLMWQARQVGGLEANLFLFTTLARVEAGDVLADALWHQAGRQAPLALLD